MASLARAARDFFKDFGWTKTCSSSCAPLCRPVGSDQCTTRDSTSTEAGGLSTPWVRARTRSYRGAKTAC
eukprot:7379806-Prymnesium_polylepis.1